MTVVAVKVVCFSTIQYNTTVKLPQMRKGFSDSFSTIQYNTTVKPQS